MVNPSKNSVLFVVLNFNGWEETLSCIDAISVQTYRNFHILLIDNGSHDDSLQKLSKYDKDKNITFLKQPVNLGFAGGVNVGIRHAIRHGYRYTALLNNDAVISKEWLDVLVRKVEEVGANTITGLVLSGDGKNIESTGDCFSNWGLPFPRQRGEPASSACQSGFVFGGSAGASLYETSVFKDIGLFDERFFAYFEDTDISFRAQLRGYSSYYEKSAIVYHNHGTTSNKIPGFTVYQYFKNLPQVYIKNCPLLLLLPMSVRFIVYFSFVYVRAIIRGQGVAATKGAGKAISLIFGSLSSRQSIQKGRRVSLGYIHTIIYHGLPPANKDKLRMLFNGSK